MVGLLVVGRSVVWSVDWEVGWSVCWLVGRSVVWLVGLSVGWRKYETVAIRRQKGFHWQISFMSGFYLVHVLFWM